MMKVTNRQKLGQTQNLPLIECIHEFIVRDSQFTSQTISTVNRLHLEDHITCQLLSFMIGKYVQRQINRKELSLPDINENIVRTLESFTQEHEIQVQDHEFDKTEEKKKNIFTIEFSNRRHSVFQEKQFNNHLHLFSKLKQFHKKEVQKVKPTIESIMKSIQKVYCPLQSSITSKIDNHNLETSINHLIISMFPEHSQQRQNGLKFIYEKLGSLNNPSLYELNSTLKKSIEDYITKILKFLSQKKMSIIFNINDWIETDFYYSSQEDIIKAIELIQQECKRKKYEIVHVDDDKFDSKDKQQPSCLNIVIKVNEVCCKFNFYYKINYRSHRLKQYLKKIIKFKFGSSIFGLMEMSKKYKKTLNSHIKEAVQSMKQQTIDESINLLAISQFSDEFIKRSEQTHSSMSSSMITNTNRYDISPSRLDQRSQTEYEKPILQLKRLQDAFNYVSSREDMSTERSNRNDLQSGLDNRKQTLEEKELSLTPRTLEKIQYGTQVDEKESNNCYCKEHEQMPKTIKQKQIVISKKDKQIAALKQKVSKLQQTIKIRQTAKNQISQEFKGQKAQYILYENKLKEKEALQSQLKSIINDLRAKNEHLQKQKLYQTDMNSRQCSQNQQLTKNIQYLSQLVSSLKEENESLSNSIQKLQQSTQYLNKELQSKTQILFKSQKLLQEQKQAKLIIETQMQLLKNEINNQKQVKNQIDKNQMKTMLLQLNKIRETYHDNTECQKALKAIESNIINTIKSGNQMIFQQLKKGENKTTSTEHDDSEKEQSQQDQIVEQKGQIIKEIILSCNSCQIQRDKTWKAEKKLIYLTLFFLIVLFQAVTFRFSIYIFK